ncbi:MAG: hypothetical protein J6A87_04625, partial [Clostridia bacterium]|nr:hypothetical protein [Clostridia bacterium]
TEPYATKGKRKLDKSMSPSHLADFYGSNASRTRRARISRRERTLLYATKGKRKLDKSMSPSHLADFYGSNASRTRRARISRRERTSRTRPRENASSTKLCAVFQP